MDDDSYMISSKDVENNLCNLMQLVFEVTDKCNLNCKYCGYGDMYGGYDERKNVNLSINKAYRIIDYLVNFWEDKIDHSLRRPFTIGFYGGEPLIGIDFIKEITRYIESLNISSKKIHYSMTTNGVLLNKYMDFIAQKEFRLMISLDGNEQNHSYRVNHGGQNSHRIIVQNIFLLKNKYPDYFKRFVRFNSVLHNRNSIQDINSFIQSKFKKKPRISILNNSGIKKDKVDEYTRMFQSKEGSIKEADNAKALSDEIFLESPSIHQLTTVLFRHSGNIFDNHKSLLIDPDRTKYLPTGTCTPFSRKMFITVSGKILPCELVDHCCSLGQVFEESIELDLTYIATYYNELVSKFKNTCKLCSIKGKCQQCIFQIDNLQQEKAICPSYLGPRAFKNYINANLRFLGENPSLYKKIMASVRIE
jgi:uncharacterized protein